MNEKLKRAFDKEMGQAKRFYREAKYDVSFKYLERAHILGQSYILPHTLSHWWMLKVGLRTAQIKEVTGQIFRISAALILSRIWVPEGNTGGANVSPLAVMPIPKDLQRYLS